jgi:hypothetical protein
MIAASLLALAGAVDHTAVIIEPRPHALLIPVIQNFMAKLPHEWKFQLVHGTANEEFLRQSDLCAVIESGKLTLRPLEGDDLNMLEYNKLLTSTKFWEDCGGEKVLLFQSDTALCSGSKHQISDFMEYDFIGAPWPEFSWWLKPGQIPVGNGGLTLRSKSLMLKVLQQHSWDNTTMEDVWFSDMIQQHFPGSNVAPVAVAKRFSVESQFALAPFGVHVPQRFLSAAQLKLLYPACPEAALIEKHGNNPKAKKEAEEGIDVEGTVDDAPPASGGLALKALCELQAVSITGTADAKAAIAMQCSAAHYPDGTLPASMRGAGPLLVALSENACERLSVAEDVPIGFVLAVRRGGCAFTDKALVAQKAGAAAIMIVDVEDKYEDGYRGHDETGERIISEPPPPGLGEQGVEIPVVMVHNRSWLTLLGGDNSGDGTFMLVKLLDADMRHVAGVGLPRATKTTPAGEDDEKGGAGMAGGIGRGSVLPEGALYLHREALKEVCDFVVDEGKLPEVHLAVHLIGHLAVHLIGHLAVHLIGHLAVHLIGHLAVHLIGHLAVRLIGHLAVHLIGHLAVHLIGHLAVHLIGHLAVHLIGHLAVRLIGHLAVHLGHLRSLDSQIVPTATLLHFCTCAANAPPPSSLSSLLRLPTSAGIFRAHTHHDTAFHHSSSTPTICNGISATPPPASVRDISAPSVAPAYHSAHG